VQVHYRSIQVSPKSRAATIAVGAAVLVVGGALVVVGATLLLAAVSVAAIAGTGVLLYRRLTGSAKRSAPPVVPPADLDPRLEVFAPDDDRRLPPSR
jgi:hypothetical protein